MIWIWRLQILEMPERLEIVGDGLPLFGGAQLAIDTSLISTLHCDGTARLGTADTDWAAFDGCQEEERAHVSGVGRPPRKGQTGGLSR